VVLAIEDLQWVDAATRALLAFLMVRLADRPLALVATARPEALAEGAEPLRGAERIDLRELGTAEIAAIVERVLGTPAPALVERAAGNPYFAEELALAVRAGADPAALPATVEGAVRARLDQLSPPEKDCLKRAAVLGRRFWVEALRALGEKDAPPLLAALRRRELVVPRPDTRLAGCREWFFRHAVVHEACLEMLTPAQLQALHRLAARWLGERPDAPREEVAEHHAAAGETALARPHWISAALAADQRGDSERVVAFSDAALAAPEGGTGSQSLDALTEHGVRLRRAEALFWLSRHRESERELVLLDALEQLAHPPIAAGPRTERRLLWSVILSTTGRHVEAASAAAAAMGVADETGDRGTGARARGRLAMCLAATGRHADAAQAAAEATAMADESGDARARAFTLEARAFAAALRGEKALALAVRRSATEVFDAAGDVRRATVGAANMGSSLQALGDLDGARQVLEAALTTSRALGLRRTECSALHNLGLVYARLGVPAAGLAAEEEALALAREDDEPRLVSGALVYRGLIRLAMDEPGAAAADADEALGLSLARAPTLEPLCRTVRAAALVALGRPAEALDECRRALALRDAAGGMEELEVDLLLAHHDALAALGRAAQARAALLDARVAFERTRDAIDEAALRRCYAERLPAHVRLQALLAAPT
jgi:tetratricopeptide (TPR) repeat protein